MICPFDLRIFFRLEWLNNRIVFDRAFRIETYSRTSGRLLECHKGLKLNARWTFTFHVFSADPGSFFSWQFFFQLQTPESEVSSLPTIQETSKNERNPNDLSTYQQVASNTSISLPETNNMPSPPETSPWLVGLVGWLVGWFSLDDSFPFRGPKTRPMSFRGSTSTCFLLLPPGGRAATEEALAVDWQDFRRRIHRWWHGCHGDPGWWDRAMVGKPGDGRFDFEAGKKFWTQSFFFGEVLKGCEGWIDYWEYREYIIYFLRNVYMYIFNYTYPS